MTTCLMKCGEHSGPPYTLCKFNKAPIQRNAERNFCPHPNGSRFNPAIPPLPNMDGIGDVVAAFFKVLGIDSVVKYFASKMKKNCGCPARQKIMNSRFAGLWNWVIDWLNILYCPSCQHVHG